MNEQCKKCTECYVKALTENWKYGCSAGYEHTRPDGSCVLFNEIKDDKDNTNN